MKLGKQTASVTNWLMSGTQGQPIPEVGMGVTELHWTDRHAGTIVRISPSGKTFWYQRDIATRTDTNGMSESQSYSYAPDPNAALVAARRNKRGEWKATPGGTQLRLGQRSAYHDYSF